jgi:hypothetical protein
MDPTVCPRAIRPALRFRIPGVETLPLVDDAELEAAALAADPEVVVPDDAIPFDEWRGTPAPGALPTWYMPTPMAPRALRGWRRLAARVSSTLLVLSFLTITAAGLCNTYGDLHL